MKIAESSKPVNYDHDIVICGGGVAGLWLLNILVNAGYDVLLIEKGALGGIQTIASQGMIHGGQRYMLGLNPSSHAEIVAPLPKRWDACLQGFGELNLREVRILSETQVMWSIGNRFMNLALNTATKFLKSKVRKLDPHSVPRALADLSNISVYELPEKVLDIYSLVRALSSPYIARIKKGIVESISRNGHITVSGVNITAKIIICAAGLGNEGLLMQLNAGGDLTQRRPLRQFMVKTMPFPLFGHGITTSHKPRVTVTSHPLPKGGYIWYLGGALADDSLSLSESDAIVFAKKEMEAVFNHIDWSGKQWASWYGVRAEAFSQNGKLPIGPIIKEYGDTFVVWPTKLTLTPLLGDQIVSLLANRNVTPNPIGYASKITDLSPPVFASAPWDTVNWM